MFSRQGETIFQLFDKRMSDWHQSIKENIVGGPSIVFTRYHEKNETTISGSPVATILGFDASALYLFCTGKPMPTGIAAEWKPVNDAWIEVPTEYVDDFDFEKVITQNMKKRFRRRSTIPYQKEHVWILYMSRKLKRRHPNITNIQHKFNGGQKVFYLDDGTRAFVDGWVPELNLVLEFQGCYFHGHDCISDGSEIRKKQRLERAARTKSRIHALKRLGLQVIEGRECEVEKIIDSEFQELVENHTYTEKKESAGQLVQNIKNDSIFGIVECDIQVPCWKPQLREHMEELPPIFKNTIVTLDDVGDVMKDFAKKHGIAESRRSLISSYHATKMIFTTPLLKYYLNLELVITRIYRILQFQPEPVFKFVETAVTNARRKADQSDADKALGQTAKLYGNSCYGKCLTDKDKHKLCKFMNEREAMRAVNKPGFSRCENISDEIYEVEMSKSKITYDLPMLVAFFVYAYAKERILQFYYDFLLEVLDPRDFELIQMDTDSLYFACTADTLEETVRPERKAVFQKLKKLFLPYPPETDDRTPGLFKLEWSGDKMIALNSKCYCGDGQSLKLSCKGVNKATNKLTTDIYLETLRTGNEYLATTIGFRMKNEVLQQYEQEKRALTWFYPKRKVLADGIRTAPLDI